MMVVSSIRPVELAELLFSLDSGQLTDEREALARARRSLRDQITRLERELSDLFVSAYADGMDDAEFAALRGHSETSGPRLLDLAELEELRDRLLARLQDGRRLQVENADLIELRRIALEQILADPAKHKFERLQLRELGARNCGYYQVRPRLGLIGMMRGWWQVKLSSGCPLPGGRGWEPRPGLSR